MSTNPGMTSRPSASMTRRADVCRFPTSVIVDPSIATSAVRAGDPVPSTTVPPRINRSGSLMLAPSRRFAPGRSGHARCSAGYPPPDARSCLCLLADGGQHLAGEELVRGTGVVAVGAERRTGDDEAVDAEAHERTEPGGAVLGRADDREAVDEVALERGVVRGGVPEVLVAVVAATDLRDDRTVVVVEPGTGRPGHRREVGKRGHRTGDQAARDVDVPMTPDVDVRAERELGGIAARVGGGLPREVDRPCHTVGIGADRERDALGDPRRERDDAWSGRRDVERDLRLPRACQPEQATRSAVALE